VTTAVATRQPANALSLACFFLAGNLHAVDALGSLLWRYPWAAAPAVTHLSGWQNISSSCCSSGSSNGSGVLYLSEIQPPHPTQPSVFRNTSVRALDAASGRTLWETNLTAVGTAAFGVTPIQSVVAAPGLALYASGSRVAAVYAASGEQAWSYTWALLVSEY
jgi:outer membrane protein assembly factor BamB